MKTNKFRSLPAILLLSVSVLLSCSKSQKLAEAQDELLQPGQEQSAAPVAGANNEAVSYCSVDSIPLYWKNSQQDLSWVQVKRGSDQNVYVTFRATNTFFFKQINLYCGAPGTVPTQLDLFPSKVTFANPFPNQTYTFVLPNLPASFTVVGYAVVVHKSSNGHITGNVKEGWLNGSSGLNLCNLVPGNCGDLKGGSYYNYSSAGCFPVAPPPPPPPPPPSSVTAATEPNTCSKAVDHFFAVDPYYGSILAWPVTDVTIGGYTYTEAEGRDIAATAGDEDSKFALLRVAALKLSKTNYTASPTLAPAVITIENWLSTLGKLSPSSLPTGNTNVRNAAVVIDNWINTHICPERR